MRANVRALASEFPNDNPLLHGGTSWICLTTTGVPTGERTFLDELEASAEPDDTPIEVADLEPLADDAIELVSLSLSDVPVPVPVPDLAPEPPEPSVIPAFEAVITASLPSDVPPPPDDPFHTLVCLLADVAIAAGAHDVASWLPGLLFEGRLPDALDDAAMNALRTGGLLLDGSPPVIDPVFVARVDAWRAILRGTSDDFDACGSAMLDEWTSSLLAALLGQPSTTMRQELRSRGVAAFGMAA
jgi:hypothetical protein